jgi:hypothetical protein
LSDKQWKTLRGRFHKEFHPYGRTVIFIFFACHAARTGKFPLRWIQVLFRFKNVPRITGKRAEGKKRKCKFSVDGIKIEKPLAAES